MSRRVLVTGGASGLGAALVKAFKGEQGDSGAPELEAVKQRIETARKFFTALRSKDKVYTHLIDAYDQGEYKTCVEHEFIARALAVAAQLEWDRQRKAHHKLGGDIARLAQQIGVDIKKS